MIKFTKKSTDSRLSPEGYSVLFPAYPFDLSVFTNLSLHLSCNLRFSPDLSVFVHLVYVPTNVHSACPQGRRPTFPPFVKDFRHVSPCFCPIPAASPRQSCKLSLFRSRFAPPLRKPMESIANEVCAFCTCTILNSVSFTHFERIQKAGRARCAKKRALYTTCDLRQPWPSTRMTLTWETVPPSISESAARTARSLARCVRKTSCA